MESALEDNEGTQSFWLSAKQLKQKVNQKNIHCTKLQHQDPPKYFLATVIGKAKQVTGINLHSK